ncbi:hypothetical protein SSUR61_0945 [Streptococcus suis R61]|uniref:Uncharacterized protein n=1 Tax=Streptococcus suis R61 TaxID=996306 RepID=A0AA87F8J0_STRSU|nr:hypothetical protein SSUR61_0945 [Streptococcus suis R61]
MQASLFVSGHGSGITIMPIPEESMLGRTEARNTMSNKQGSH